MGDGLLFVIAFPTAVFLAILGTIYMRRIYNKTAKPRSWFFRMLINSSVLQVVCGIIIGYIGIRSIGLQLHAFDLPAPPTEWIRVIIVIVAVILVSPPIYFAFNILRARRRANGKVNGVGSSGKKNGGL